jgi:hypothetical protein
MAFFTNNFGQHETCPGGGSACYGCFGEYAFNDTVWEAGTGVTWDTDHFVAPHASGPQLEITTASPQCQGEGTVTLQVVVEAVNPSFSGGVAVLVISVRNDEDYILESSTTSWDGIETTFTLNATFPYVTTGKLKINVFVLGVGASWDYLHITAVTLSCGAPGELYCFGNTEEGCTSECYIDMIGNEAANCAVFGGVWNSLSNQCVKYEPIPGEYVSYQVVRCALRH